MTTIYVQPRYFSNEGAAWRWIADCDKPREWTVERRRMAWDPSKRFVAVWVGAE